MILSFLLNNRLARAIGVALMAVLAVLTFGKIERRKGVKAERQRQATAEAKAHSETIAKVLHETPSDDTADRLRERMRQRAKR